MGCDIHAYWEVKHKEKWMPWGEARTERWYYPFALMAGVRDYANDMIYKAKGLPEDVTDLVKSISDSSSSDGHTHSYLSADELKKVYETVRDDLDVDEEMVDALRHWFEALEHVCAWEIVRETEPIEDVRLVFWFDS